MKAISTTNKPNLQDLIFPHHFNKFHLFIKVPNKNRSLVKQHKEKNQESEQRSKERNMKIYGIKIHETQKLRENQINVP